MLQVTASGTVLWIAGSDPDSPAATPGTDWGFAAPGERARVAAELTALAASGAHEGTLRFRMLAANSHEVPVRATVRMLHQDSGWQAILALAPAPTEPAADLVVTRQDQLGVIGQMATDWSNPVLVMATDSEIRWVSERGVNPLGWDADALIGRKLVDLMHPADAGVARLVPDTEGGLFPPTFRARIRTQDGGYIWYRVCGHSLLDLSDQGARVGWVGDFQEIGHRLVSHDAQPGSATDDPERRFLDAVSRSAIGTAVLAATGTIAWANAAFAHMLGRQPESVVDLELGELLADEPDVAHLGEVIDSVCAGAFDGARELLRFQRPDGGVIWGDIAVSTVRDREGGIRHIVCQVVDQTEAVATGQDLARTQSRLQLVLAASQEALLQVDAGSGVIQWASPTAAEILGWHPDDLLGVAFGELLHPGDRLPGSSDEAGGSAGAGTSADAGPSAATGPRGHVLLRVRHPDGGFRWVSARSQPGTDPDSGGDLLLLVLGRAEPTSDPTPSHLPAEQLREVLENTVDVIVRYHPDGTLAWASPSLETLLGYRPQDVIGTRFIPADEFEVAAATQLLRARLPERPHNVPLRLQLRHRDGRRRWMDAQLRLVWADTGRVEFVVAVLRDITEQVRVQRALAASEARYRMLAEHSGEVVIGLGEDGTITWVSPSVRGSLGWRRTDLRGRSPAEFVHPEDHEVYRRGTAALTRKGKARIRVRLRTGDGDYRWMECRARRLPGKDPVLVQAWRDIDEEVTATRALAESEEHFRLLADNSTDVVLQAGPDQRLIWVSPSITERLGWQPGEVIGRPVTDLIHPDDLAAIAAQLSGQPGRGSAEGGIEARFATADGGWRWMSDHGRQLVDSRGRRVGTIDALRDVQAEHEAREQIQLERARLAATLDSMLDPHVVLETVRGAQGELVDLRFGHANAAACAALGRPPAELIGTQLAAITDPEGWRALVGLFDSLLASGEPIALDNQPMPGQGQPPGRRYDLRAVRVGDAVSFTWRDVTDRYQASEALATSEARYRLLAENATDVVYRMSPTLVFEWLTRGVQRTLGWTVEQLLGRCALDFIDPRDRLQIIERIPAAMAGSRTSLRVRALTSTGSSRWIEITAHPVYDRSRRVIALAGGMRDVNAEVEAEKELDRRARTDQLTGLLNRGEALARLAQVLSHPRRGGRKLAVAFCDLDDFKTVNDTRGHAAGDRLLGTVADRIRASVRAGDMVARVGGDEILIVFDGVRDLDEAVELADRIRRIVAIPIQVPHGRGPDGPLITTVSIGVTIARPEDDMDALVARADQAMYRAKQTGRDRVVRLDRD